MLPVLRSHLDVSAPEYARNRAAGPEQPARLDEELGRAVTAAADGVVTELRVGPGDQVETGQVLAVVAAVRG